MAYVPTGITSIVNTVPSSVLVGASVIGQLAPHSVLVLNPVSTLAVTGTLGASVIGHAPVVIVGGSILTSSTANQSVSGTVQTDVRGSVAVAIISGSVAVATGNSSVQVLNFPANQSVSGAVSISNLPTTQNVSGSVVAFQGTPEWTVKSSLAGGLFPISGSVAAVITNTNLNVGGSVVAFQGGTQITSLVSTVPSSVIVGTSIFGQLPAGTAPLGSVATLQGTNPWNIAGSVASFQAGTQITSISGVPQVSVHGTVAIFPASMVTGHGSVNGAASVQILHSVAGLHNYITDFTLSNTGAATTLVTFTDGDASIIGRAIAPAGGGAVATGLIVPMRTMAVNKVVNIAAATATSVLYAWVGGYKAP